MKRQLRTQDRTRQKLSPEETFKKEGGQRVFRHRDLQQAVRQMLAAVTRVTLGRFIAMRGVPPGGGSGICLGL